MALRNGLIGIALELRAANDMAPEHTNPITALDGNDLAGHGLLEVGVAGDVCIVDVLDRVVAERGADADCLAVVGAVDAGELAGRDGGEGRRTGRAGRWCGL